MTTREAFDSFAARAKDTHFDHPWAWTECDICRRVVRELEHAYAAGRADERKRCVEIARGHSFTGHACTTFEDCVYVVAAAIEKEDAP
jgi:hypothetical protein